ncbi:hypothetical protein D3C86_1697820 [compost metagenome]
MYRIVTINVPKNNERGKFLSGFRISPAINVTLFHASEEKSELIMVVERTIIKPTVVRGTASSHEPSAAFFVEVASHILWKFSSKKPE